MNTTHDTFAKFADAVSCIATGSNRDGQLLTVTISNESIGLGNTIAATLPELVNVLRAINPSELDPWQKIEELEQELEYAKEDLKEEEKRHEEDISSMVDKDEHDEEIAALESSSRGVDIASVLSNSGTMTKAKIDSLRAHLVAWANENNLPYAANAAKEIC